MSSRDHERVFHVNGDKRVVKQADKEACDINVIVSKYRSTGVPPTGRSGAMYGDFTASTDYYQVVNRVLEARTSFDALPAAVRQYCQNDVGVFLDAVVDPEKLEVMRELGLPFGESSSAPGVSDNVSDTSEDNDTGDTSEGAEEESPGREA